ncbi:MAG TPA: hypothetical protein VF796_06320 [Humisphaera sp.]
MKKPLALAAAVAFALPTSLLFSADAPAPKPAPAAATKPATTKPALKITPGKVVVPFGTMRRPWGELISLDPVTRTGTFRNESTDEVMPFTIVPYAELLHHATFGDLQDFRVGERLIFRLHPDESGKWVWLTYIQDEMNMMNGHKEFYFVDAIDAATGKLTCTQANADKSFVRQQGIVIESAPDTRYWKAGKPAAFADIKPGDKLRERSHGVGKGNRRVAWDLFLDEESLLAFQAEQKAVHAARMARDGAPGYIDESAGGKLKVTLFQEGGDYVAKLAKGQPVQVAPAGVDRKPTKPAVKGTVAEVKRTGKLTAVTVDLPATGGATFDVGSVMRLWVGE